VISGVTIRIRGLLCFFWAIRRFPSAFSDWNNGKPDLQDYYGIQLRPVEGDGFSALIVAEAHQ
jgi:hypothetical protein